MIPDPVRHLQPTLDAFERGDLSKDEEIRLWSDLLVYAAVPDEHRGRVQHLVDDGWLTQVGDVLRYEADGGYARQGGAEIDEDHPLRR